MKEYEENPCPKYIDLHEESLINYYEQERMRPWLLKLWILCAILIYVGILLIIRGFRYPKAFIYHSSYDSKKLMGYLIGFIGIFILIVSSLIIIPTVLIIPMTKKVLGMTDKRAFYFEQSGKRDFFISSKIQLTNLKFQLKRIHPIIYLIAAILLVIGLLLLATSYYEVRNTPFYMTPFYPKEPFNLILLDPYSEVSYLTLSQFIYVSIAFFFIIIVIFIIILAIIYRRQGITKTFLGENDIKLINLKGDKIAEMRQFIKSVHSFYDISTSGFHQGLAIYRKILKYVIIVLGIFILIMILY
jgi:hypothetical protein